MNYFNSSNSKMNELRRKHKLKKPIKTFGLPAVKTCPMAGDCKKSFKVDGEKKYHCFATQGAYVWPTVKAAYQRRLKHSRSKTFVDDMVSSLRRSKSDYVRLHDSGDFYNARYLSKWIKIMQACPSVSFWCYTKSVSLFKQFEKAGMMPDNFYYVYSMGGREDHLITHDDRYSKTIAPHRIKTFKHNGFRDLTADELQILDRGQLEFFTVAH